MSSRPPTAVIENVSPLIDGGRYLGKRVIAESLVVEADIFKEGHDIVSAILKWRRDREPRWYETPMAPISDRQDRWRGECAFFENAVHEFTIEAWGNTFLTWQHDFRAKFLAGQDDLRSETLEGAAFVAKAAERAGATPDAARLQHFAARLREATPEQVDALAHWSELEGLMMTWADRSESAEFVLHLPPMGQLVEGVAAPQAVAAVARKGRKSAKKEKLSAGTPASSGATGRADHPAYPRVYVDRERAGFSTWYEFFPRSAEGLPDRGSTFRECLPRVEDARAMGFDVIYFPPIHPIGITARKGRNNSLECEPGEPGVPYAIGNRHQGCPNGGGHKDVAPELGTLEDFGWLVDEIRERGLEVALDFALNCSPDHPYVSEHPEWFYQRPDGTIKYAENPPKKYQDVYPLNFHNANWRSLWEELTHVIEFWCEHRVRIFRVDNPHTKPVAFWEYLIARVQSRWPDTIFLSEAFTRPKMMHVLAKAGFTQNYTYFTWRNTKRGLTEYFTDLTMTGTVECMRPNLWPNTPDILPSYLQFGGRPSFLVRALLAATLSPIYGIYSGFELCENSGVARSAWDPASDVRQFLQLCDWDYKQLAREEYLDSEKYQFKARDWNAPGNIKAFLTRLNRVRRENRALQQIRNLRFQHADNDLVLCYSKATVARDNCLLIVVNLDAWHAQDTFVHVPLEAFGLGETELYQVHDLLDDERYLWSGRRNFARLDPKTRPGHVFRIRRLVRREIDFDYFM
ncbi:MAG: alpha-1,4-glucan--maltose-1-phosphate maltosyltransferase [Verrucomicrobiota bacterium]|nr:alpha-1,4-glucan--maltose-1-phosphate maltosyltransferase [Verrucomicrobiota bacterium]